MMKMMSIFEVTLPNSFIIILILRERDHHHHHHHHHHHGHGHGHGHSHGHSHDDKRSIDKAAFSHAFFLRRFQDNFFHLSMSETE